MNSKIVLTMAFGIMFLVLSLGFVSALDFDNVKTYDRDNREYLVENTFGLGKDLAKIRLISDLNEQVFAGTDVKVAEVYIENYGDYGNFFKNMQLYNGEDLDQEVKRDIVFKFKQETVEIVPKITTECAIDSSELLGNGSLAHTYDCIEYRDGTKEVRTVNWIPLSEERLNNLPEGNYTIGLFTDVKENERVDWVPTWAGERLDEWATWTSDLTAELYSYYPLNLTDANVMVDSVFSRNGTALNAGVAGVEGILNNSFDFPGDAFYNLTTTNVTFRNESFTWNFWSNIDTCAGDQYLLDRRNGGASQSNTAYSIACIGNQWFVFSADATGGELTLSSGANSINFGDWIMTTFSYENTTGNISLFINGTAVDSLIHVAGAGPLREWFTNDELYSGKRNFGGSGDKAFDGQVDEMGYWGKALNNSQVEALYNAGLALAFQRAPASTPPTVTLNSPGNATNFTVQSVTFNYTAEDAVNVTNVTLFIDGVANTTTIVGDTNSTNIETTLTFADGSFIWHVGAFNNASAGAQQGNSTEFTFMVNATVPIVTLNSPANLTTHSTQNVTFNYTVEDAVNVTNVTLFIDGVANFTTIFSTGNSTNIATSLNFSDGDYLWQVTARNGDNLEGFSEERNFTVDTTGPTININTPILDPFGESPRVNATLNATITDSNLGTCFYHTSDSDTNITYTCNTLENITFTTLGNKTIFAYANDTVGNEARNTTSFFPVFYNQSAERNNVTEGDSVLFTIVVNRTDIATTTGELVWNNTRFGPTFIASSTDGYEFRRQLEIPGGTGNSSGINISWNWDINMTNTNSQNFSTRSVNQTVFTFAIDDCSVFSNVVLNYTMVDEDTQNMIVPNGNETNTTIEITVTITPHGNLSNIVGNFSNNYTNENPAAVCFDAPLTTTDHRADVLVRYESTDHVSEFHNIQNLSLNSNTTSKNITLYDLLTSRSQEFLITYKDENFLPLADVLIDITRFYIGDGVFRSVEVPKTDTAGQAIGHFVLSDVIYNIVITKDGKILSTFEGITAICANQATGDCTINLNAFNTVANPDDFATRDGITYNVVYNEVTREISVQFSTLDGSPATVFVNTTLNDAYQNTSICTDTLTTSTGTLICSVPVAFGNVSLKTDVFKDSGFVGTTWIFLDSNPDDIWGGTRFVMMLLLYLTIPMMFISSGVGIVIASIFGFAIAMILNIIPMGGGFFGVGTTIIWLIVAGTIVIWKIMNRE